MRTLDMIFVGCTIRRIDATTWDVVSDAGHEPIGVDHVQLLADRVRVWYETPASKVISFHCTPDDGFTASDVRVGASVGLKYADIFFHMPAYGTVPVNPALLTKAKTNVWITGWFKEVDNGCA